MSEVRLMTPLTGSEIRASFSRREQRDLKLPNLTAVDWSNLDFLGWRGPGTELAFVVFDWKESLKGITFRYNKGGTSNQRMTMMCSWCKTLQSRDGIQLYTTLKSDGNKSMGDYLCRDLQCSLYVRGIDLPATARMPESISVDKRIERLRENVQTFYDRLASF